MKGQNQLEESRQQPLPPWAVVVLLVIVVIVAIILIPRLPPVIQLNQHASEVFLFPTEENKRRFDVSLALVQSVVSGVGTLAAIVSGFVLYQNFTVASRNAEIASRNAEIAEDKQIAERFAKAVEQLGNKEQQQVRLGGIYSLERIAKNSKKDLWTVVEVLSSFVREYSVGWSEYVEVLLQSALEGRLDRLQVDEPATSGILQSQSPKITELRDFPTEIRAVFAVLNHLYEKRNYDYMINLRGVNLSFKNMDDINLSFVDFHKAQLIGASFMYSKLIGSRLHFAQLRLASFFRANLTLAFFYGADLTGARLNDADLSCARFNKADVSNTEFDGTILFMTDLSESKGLQRAQLTKALLCKAKLPTELEDLSDRDCDLLPQVLSKRYPDRLKSIEDARQFIEKQESEG